VLSKALRALLRAIYFCHAMRLQTAIAFRFDLDEARDFYLGFGDNA
jgi:hypothetical protein